MARSATPTRPRVITELSMARSLSAFDCCTISPPDRIKKYAPTAKKGREKRTNPRAAPVTDLPVANPAPSQTAIPTPTIIRTMPMVLLCITPPCCSRGATRAGRRRATSSVTLSLRRRPRPRPRRTGAARRPRAGRAPRLSGPEAASAAASGEPAAETSSTAAPGPAAGTGAGGFRGEHVRHAVQTAEEPVGDIVETQAAETARHTRRHAARHAADVGDYRPGARSGAGPV